MNITAIFNFLLIAGAVQGFVFNIATFLARRKIEKPVLFLNLFVLFLSLNNLQSWLIDKDLVSSIFYLQHFRIPWYVLIVPMFYAFLVYYLGIEKKKWPFLTVTAIIFFAEVIARIVVLILVGNRYFDLNTIETYNTVEDALTLFYSLFLFVKAIRILYNYSGLYKPILEFDNLNWIKKFLKLGGLVIFLWLFAVLLNIFSDLIKPPYSYYPLRLGSSILIYWVGYQAFFQYVILKDRIRLRGEIRKPSTSVNLGSANPTAHSNSREKGEEVFGHIDYYVRSKQRFLDPYLSMEKVAEELSMGTSSLSKLINQYSGHNFSDYINSLRVSQAKELLINEDFKAYTMVAIGLECGFNSKSTFYSSFKKFTGKTPTEYRNQTFNAFG